MSKDFRLSKSKIMAGTQCKRRLWLETHRRELMRVTPASEHIFRMGHLFGECARPLMGQGELIGHVLDVTRAVAETHDALRRAAAQGSIVFEAAFSHQNVVARADGFAPCAKGWHMTEVKAAGTIKEYFYLDCAIQAWVAEGAGYPVRTVTLACIESRFVYPGGGDYGGLLRHIDVTKEVARRKTSVNRIVDDMREALSLDEPLIPVGPHCTSPYACPFVAHCGAQAAETRRKSRGPDNHVRVDRPKVLAYPRHFLHFESIASPVPLWPGARPYQRIPVLWSCQTETQSGQVVEHAHLDLFNVSSKESFARTLLNVLGSDDGIIVATAVERACLEALRSSVPDLAAELGALLQRLVHSTGVPVASEVADIAEHSDIADGESAEQAWWEAASPDTGEERKQRIAASLLLYGKRYAHSMRKAFKEHGTLVPVRPDVSRIDPLETIPRKTTNATKC